MTLSTDIYIQGEVDPTELQQVVKAALAKFDDEHRTPDQQIWEQGGTYSPHSVCTMVGQGLPAWTFIHFGEKGAWRAPEDKYSDPEDVEEGEEPRFVAPRHFAAIDFDTAYGYQGPNGMTCNHLHVLLMSEVGDWLRPQGVSWQWRNEYSGEIHDGFTGFETLVSDGIGVQAWFQDIAKPAIEADILRSETTEEGPR